MNEGEEIRRFYELFSICYSTSQSKFLFLKLKFANTFFLKSRSRFSRDFFPSVAISNHPWKLKFANWMNNLIVFKVDHSIASVIVLDNSEALTNYASFISIHPPQRAFVWHRNCELILLNHWTFGLSLIDGLLEWQSSMISFHA